MSGVPRRTDTYTLKKTDMVLILDIFPAATIRPSGNENIIVKKKIPNEKANPCPRIFTVLNKVL